MTHPMPRTAVVLLAAGEGRRVGADTNKVLLPLAGAPVFTWSLRRALELPGTTHVVLVIRPEDRAEIDRGLELVAADHEGAKVWVVPGGATRHGSEWNALGAVAAAVDAGEVDVIAIHDTARPLADAGLFAEVARVAHEHGGALPVRAQRALVPRDAPRDASPDAPRDDVPRDDALPREAGLVAVQTPQAFRAGALLDAYRRAEQDGFVGTDTASCVEAYTDLEICCVASPATNIKITFPEDVPLAERLVSPPDAPHASSP